MDILNGRAGESELKMDSISAPDTQPEDPSPLEAGTDSETPAHPSQTDTLSGGESKRWWVAAVQSFIHPNLLQSPGKALSFEEIYKGKLFPI
jgi:hypothetical protein